jgi:hypothetical protein
MAAFDENGCAQDFTRMVEGSVPVFAALPLCLDRNRILDLDPTLGSPGRIWPSEPLLVEAQFLNLSSFALT